MNRMRILVPLFIMGLLIAGCGGSQFEKDIIGAWEAGATTEDGVPFTMIWEFYEDGTTIITTKTILDFSSSFTGTYEFEDEDTIALHNDEEPDAAPGRRDIRMPDEDTLILTAPVSGDQLIFKRSQTQ